MAHREGRPVHGTWSVVPAGAAHPGLAGRVWSHRPKTERSIGLDGLGGNQPHLEPVVAAPERVSRRSQTGLTRLTGGTSSASSDALCLPPHWHGKRTNA